MKLFVLGHEDTVLGFSLIGVEGFATDDSEAALQKLEEIVGRGDVGIILVTAGLATRLGERVRSLEQAATLPILLQVPAPGESLEQPPVREMVRRALGVKV
ncbi:MAG: V-type ATP synthase subunit F [Sphingomonadaceae bacterium]